MKVSIIIPYVRDRGYLQEAVASAENQTYKNIEIVLSQSSGSLGYNVNRGLDRATGEYYKVLADDDLLLPDGIEKLVEGINGFDFVCANAINFYEDGREEVYYGRKASLKECIQRNSIHGGTTLYRMDCGKWDEGLRTGEEYDYHLRLLSEGKKLNHVDSVVCKYRIWVGGKASTKSKDLKRKEYINQIKQRYV